MDKIQNMSPVPTVQRPAGKSGQATAQGADLGAPFRGTASRPASAATDLALPRVTSGAEVSAVLAALVPPAVKVQVLPPVRAPGAAPAEADAPEGDSATDAHDGTGSALLSGRQPGVAGTSTGPEAAARGGYDSALTALR